MSKSKTFICPSCDREMYHHHWQFGYAITCSCGMRGPINKSRSDATRKWLDMFPNSEEIDFVKLENARHKADEIMFGGSWTGRMSCSEENLSNHKKKS